MFGFKIFQSFFFILNLPSLFIHYHYFCLFIRSLLQLVRFDLEISFLDFEFFAAAIGTVKLSATIGFLSHSTTDQFQSFANTKLLHVKLLPHLCARLLCFSIFQSLFPSMGWRLLLSVSRKLFLSVSLLFLSWFFIVVWRFSFFMKNVFLFVVFAWRVFLIVHRFYTCACLHEASSLFQPSAFTLFLKSRVFLAGLIILWYATFSTFLLVVDQVSILVFLIRCSIF
mmetsp:Transcript_40142/g.64513  ORF Transcript_40142/g.64513 Transcript_40142/m.64513 type:complete len:226 (-) Transcript_40142:376-1053(-)